jgi:hypothetical protein
VILTGTHGPEQSTPNYISVGNVIKAYNDEVRIRFDEVLHKYTVSDVRFLGGAWCTLPSVTTVLSKMLDKKHLINWATNLSMLEFLKRIEEGKSYTRSELDAAGFQIKGAHKISLDNAGKIGSQVHAWLEKFILAREAGHGFPAPPTDPQVRSCCSAGRKWVVENDVRPIAVESILFSRKHRVIGTMDLAATLSIDGCISVCDFKSSNQLHKSYGLQLSAYKAMLLEQSGIDAEDRWLVRLDKVNGTFHPEKLSRETAAQEEKAFFELVDAYSTLSGFQFFEE